MVPEAPDEVFHKCNGRGQGGLSSQSWMGEYTVSCLPLSPRSRLSLRLLSWQPACEHDGKCCCRWKKRQSCCTSGLLISKDSISQATGTHGTTVPLEIRDFFLINQWNNVQHRYGVCELESHHWSAFHFHLELLSEKQLLFQCSQEYSCFPVTLSWLILESEYGLRENSPGFCTEKRQVINWANSATYVRNFPWKNQSSS